MTKIQVPLADDFTITQENAAKLAQLMSRFDASVMIHDQNRTVNAKSLLGILALASMRPASLEFQIDGTDEAEACFAVKTFFMP